MKRPTKSPRGETRAPAQAEPKRIFGLSIDERIRWAAPILSPKIEGGKFDWEAIEASDKGEFWLPDDEDIDIHDWLRMHLEALAHEQERLFTNVIAVGVSCIGIITEDNGVKRLSHIYRKPNWTERAEGFIINFNELFEGLFSVDAIKYFGPFLTVRNDATAKCLSEVAASTVVGYPFVFINLDAGMNCGIVVDYGNHTKIKGDVFKTALHPEFGHCRPVRHPEDRFVDPAHSGCPLHTDCYEALASGGRLYARWGTIELPDNHEQWEFVAYYIAQACFTITMLLAPATISIGGYLVRDFLIRNIKYKFNELNSSYNPSLKPDSFIRKSLVENEYFDILGALQVALSNSWLGTSFDDSNVELIEEARIRATQHARPRQ